MTLFQYYFRTGLLSLLLVLFIHPCFSQTILNGDFESNTAGSVDQINLTNSAYNVMMANSYSFGSYGDMDIIKSATYCGLAQSGTWFVAFTGGGTDAISLTLSTPLVIGNVYSISFYDRGCTSWVPFPFQFGLSTVNNAFGTVIYTSPTSPSYGTWTKRTFTFTAPNNGQYITIQMGGVLGNWGQVDNVQFVSAGVPAASHFLCSDSVLCENECTSFTDASTNNPVSWSWSFPGAYVTTSNVQNPSFICYPAAGIYPVTLHAMNAFGGDTLTVTNYVHVNASPPVPVIAQHQDTLVCSTHPSYLTYQWYLNNAPIAGATDTLLVISQSGNYNVEVTNASGCKIAVGTNVILGIKNMEYAVPGIYPNPATDKLHVSHTGRVSKVSLYNMLGEEVLSLPARQGHTAEELDIFFLPSGLYVVQLTGESLIGTYRLLKH